MVGDRLDTDILFGKGGGLSTLLVLTGTYEYGAGFCYCYILTLAYLGVTKVEQVQGENASPIIPDYVLGSLGDLAILGGT